MTSVISCVVAGCQSTSARRIKGACMMHAGRLRKNGEYGPAGRLRAECNQPCRIDGCARKATHYGLCGAHGRRRRLYGDPLGQHETGTRRCSADDCDNQHWARGWCRKHYKRWLANGTPDLLSPDDLFWRQVVRRGPDECWEWTGATVKDYGHGHVNNEHYYAHRRSFEMHVGPIPDGMVVRHRCDNPPCVNPAHLEVGTQVDNIGDMIARGRGWWQKSGATG